VDETPLDYCRQIETYLCRRNDGHLIRVVGPSFDLVSAWASRGVPLKIAFEGIDRAFERYHRKGPRRRPLKIDFCEADVLDAFEEWQRAVGIARVEAPASRESLPSHLARVVRRLSEGRASGVLGPAFDAVIDRVSEELDRAKAAPGGVRGDARRALLERLTALDLQLVAAAGESLDAEGRDALSAEAARELALYRERMAPDAFERARAAAEDRLLRERFGLPTVGL
jgi:hypothetical protein